MSGPVVVVGDALLDVDLVGEVHRVAPDAPVPVVSSPVERPRPGGAALAAELAARDGREVVLVTADADDEAARRVRALLHDGVRVVGLPSDGETPVKQRVRASGQSIVRLDSGERPGRITMDDAARDEVAEVLRTAGAVLVADYGRGVSRLGPLRGLLGACRAPVVWDPHPRGATPVPGARLVTPNQQEATTFAQAQGVDPSGAHGLALVQQQALGLAHAWQVHAVAVTLGRRGALLCDGSTTPSLVPGLEVACLDPCGAGDRFASSAAVALADGALVSEAVETAVRTAGEFVAAGGAASVCAPASEPASRGVTVATGGCFDLLHAGHVATLRAARALGDRLVVCLNSDESVRRLKGPSRPLVPAADRARVLEALACVDEVVVFEEDTPVEVLHRIRPDVWVKGGDYAGTETPEAAVMREWGGQCVTLPYLEGRSTTGLVRLAAGR
jgi:rfaE bifunctional protein nucleotidyltransferase chain/domain/rfaE bifunctional protein kinase chain/domain